MTEHCSLNFFLTKRCQTEKFIEQDRHKWIEALEKGCHRASAFGCKCTCTQRHSTVCVSRLFFQTVLNRQNSNFKLSVTTKFTFVFLENSKAARLDKGIFKWTHEGTQAWIKSEASKKMKLYAESWICWPNKTKQLIFPKFFKSNKRSVFTRKGK